jgi:hypothetical protein
MSSLADITSIRGQPYSGDVNSLQEQITHFQAGKPELRDSVAAASFAMIRP